MISTFSTTGRARSTEPIRRSALAHQLPDVDHCFGATKCGDEYQPAFQLEQADIALQVFCSHHVENDINAGALRKLTCADGKVLSPVVYRQISALVEASFYFVRAAGRRDDAASRSLYQLDGRCAYAACAAVDENRLTGLESCFHENVDVGGQVDLGQAGCFFK